MTEFLPLLDIATPDVYRKNAFRLTGLSVDATGREIERYAEKMRLQERLGVSPEPTRGPLALTTPPTAESIREAAVRLRDPERRLAEEFLWFWPATPGKSTADPGIRALSEGDEREARRIWGGTETDASSLLHTGCHGDSVQGHNLAVLWHAIALDWDLDPRRRTSASAAWWRAHQYWALIVNGFAFWEDFKERIEGHGEARLTTDTVDEVETTLARVIVRIGLNRVIQIARRAAEQEADATRLGEIAADSLEIVRDFAGDVGMDDDLLEEELRLATEGLRADVRGACDATTEEANRRPENGAILARDLLQRAPVLLSPVEVLCPKGHVLFDAAADAVAMAAGRAAISFVNQTKNNKEAREVLQGALPFATGSEVKEFIRRNVKIAEENETFKRVTEVRELLARVEALSLPPMQKFEWLRDQLLPWLERFEQANRDSEDAISAAKDLLARAFREVSVEIFNSQGDRTYVVAAYNLAVHLYSDERLRAVLLEDDAALTRFYGPEFRSLGARAQIPVRRPDTVGQPMVTPRPVLRREASTQEIVRPWNALPAWAQSAVWIVAVSCVIVALSIWSNSGKDQRVAAPPAPAPAPVAAPATVPTVAIEPRPTPRDPIRLKNGTLVRRFKRKGLGKLEVNNGGDQDALVVLAGEGGQYGERGAIYVRAGSRATMSGVPTGVYTIAYEVGRDWNRERRRFNESSRRSAFEETARFDERPYVDADGSSGTEFARFEITLHAVTGGNAKTVAADPSLLELGGEE